MFFFGWAQMHFIMVKILFLLFSIMSVNVVGQIPTYIPSNGLISWYPFNGNANDASVNANNGIVNGATLTTDRFGTINSAYEFNGISNTIQAPVVMSSYSISLWYYTNSVTNIFNNLYTYNNTYTELTNDSSLYARVQYPTPPSLSLPTTYKAEFNQWHHVIAIYKSVLNTLDIYIDSVNHFSSILTNDGIYYPSWENNTIYFGGIVLNNSNYFKGKIDDIGIWNRALTSDEIADIYTNSSGNVGIGTTEPRRKLHVNDVMRLEPRNTAPSTPSKGDIYFDGVQNKLRVYDGTTWQNCW